MTIRAAGILFVTQDRRGLFLQRGADADFAGHWCIPGGKLEEGETSEQAAFRESREEAGRRVPKGPRAVLARSIRPAEPATLDMPGADVPALAIPTEPVDFTTYVQGVDEPFDVEICEESAGYAWAPVDNPPQPLHPGVALALRRLLGNELDIAQMMAAGELTSPQRYENVALFDIRITGTETSFRKAHDEYVYRKPENYLTPEFLARCNGLPVIWEHPEKSLLTSKEFGDRAVGTVFLPYIKGDEVWGIAKIYDDVAIQKMEEGRLSTSPAVNFRDPDVNTKLSLENGSVLLIEGKASLLDHIAICENGVWDKGGAPVGVNVTRADSMTDEEKAAADKARKDADDKAKADADRWAKLDAFMDSTAKFMDSTSKRLDSFESAKKDSEESKKSNEAANEPVAGDDKEAERKDPKADKARKDAKDCDDPKADKRKDSDEDDKDKKRDDSAKADSDRFSRIEADNKALRDQLAAIDRRVPGVVADADRKLLSEAQSRADSVFNAFCDRAPAPLNGESVLGYRRRLAGLMQKHSPDWKDVDLGTDTPTDKSLALAETRIYADAMDAARNPRDLAEDELRESHRFDDTGRKITSFHGQPRTWMSAFTGVPMRVKTIDNGSARRA